MEGRTIVRPDTSTSAETPAPHRTSFNGGPDNCPARPPPPRSPRPASSSLQWRAGQLSGQTRHRAQKKTTAASVLQWRAGQLSGQTAGPGRGNRAAPQPFNGGPDNCPARPCGCLNTRLREPESFNGGPDNCPARHYGVGVNQGVTMFPSMEGRTIVRPDTEGLGHSRIVG